MGSQSNHYIITIKKWKFIYSSSKLQCTTLEKDISFKGKYGKNYKFLSEYLGTSDRKAFEEYERKLIEKEARLFAFGHLLEREGIKRNWNLSEKEKAFIMNWGDLSFDKDTLTIEPITKEQYDKSELVDRFGRKERGR